MKTNRLVLMFRLAPILFILFSISCTNARSNKQPEGETEQSLEQAANEYNKKQENERYKVVCKLEAKVGTRIKTEVCRTRATMERDEKVAKKYLDSIRISVGDPKNQP